MRFWRIFSSRKKLSAKGNSLTFYKKARYRNVIVGVPNKNFRNYSIQKMTEKTAENERSRCVDGIGSGTGAGSTLCRKMGWGLHLFLYIVKYIFHHLECRWHVSVHLVVNVCPAAHLLARSLETLRLKKLKGYTLDRNFKVRRISSQSASMCAVRVQQ